ncbi:MAG: helix-hairpin-helix domain-containing protein [Halobacteriales archaeon]
MTLVERLKRLLGLGDPPAKTAGEDVTVHIEHPGVADAAERTEGSDDLEVIKGIGPTYGRRLRDVGIEDVAALAGADPADLAAETEISETRLATWIERARAQLEGP